uniref:Uncharacterized protein n=1 Tax=Lepeophtheirus salmonis TaxID=72036 RepID=A0A0K2UXM3_LEPSM
MLLLLLLLKGSSSLDII